MRIPRIFRTLCHDAWYWLWVPRGTAILFKFIIAYSEETADLESLSLCEERLSSASDTSGNQRRPAEGNPLFSKWSVATHGTALSLTLIKYFARFKWEFGCLRAAAMSALGPRRPPPLRRAKLINCNKSYSCVVSFQTSSLIKGWKHTNVQPSSSAAQNEWAF